MAEGSHCESPDALLLEAARQVLDSELVQSFSIAHAHRRCHPPVGNAHRRGALAKCAQCALALRTLSDFLAAINKESLLCQSHVYVSLLFLLQYLQQTCSYLYINPDVVLHPQREQEFAIYTDQTYRIRI